MGCEYLLVDAGWRSERWGWLRDGGDLWARATELCRYAAERNVGIVLWHAYPLGRDDGPGLTTVEAREELFRNCQQAGVKGDQDRFLRLGEQGGHRGLRGPAPAFRQVSAHDQLPWGQQTDRRSPDLAARDHPRRHPRTGIRALGFPAPAALRSAAVHTHGRRSRRFPARLCPAALPEKHHRHLSDGVGDRLQLPVSLLAGQPRGAPEPPAAPVRAHGSGYLG